METILLSVLDASFTPRGLMIAAVIMLIIFFVVKQKKLPTRKLEDLPLGEKIIARKFKRGNMVFQLKRDSERSMTSRQIENGFYLNEHPEHLEEKRTYQVTVKTVPNRDARYRTLEPA